MIARHWKGLTKKDRAADYIAHLKADTFKKLEEIKGFIRASILKRELEEGIEFLIITEWSSMKAIREFAGGDPEQAVVPEVVREMMVTFDQAVIHYEIHFTKINPS